MFDLRTAYDNLTTVRKTAAAVHQFVSETTRDELATAQWMFESNVKVAMLAMSEDELEDVMESLDDQVRAELEELRLTDAS